MKITTFNIRCDFGTDGINNFENRKSLILERIQKENPDIIGFQEVIAPVMKWLRQNLTEYTVVGCGRGEQFDGEHMVLACRRDIVNVMALHTFWLSPTPEVPGSRFEQQSICPRNCCAAMVSIEGMDSPIRVYATHLDHEGEEARRLGLQQVLKQIAEDNRNIKLPVLLLGDFNAEPDAPEMAALKDCGDMTDATANSGITYHGFNSPKDFVKIDYIYMSPEFTCTEMHPWTGDVNGVYLSDHYPVSATLELKK